MLSPQDAARLLLSVTTDLHNLSSALCRAPPEGCMDADDLLDFLNLLGLGSAVTPQKSPLDPGWQLACSGLYNIDLGLQVGG